MHRRIPFLLLAGAAFGCQPAAPPADLVLRGANVVDVVTGETVENQDVWILGERIEHIGPSGERRIHPGVEIVDVTDHYLIPGLVDAHVHLDHVDELPLYLARGVPPCSTCAACRITWSGAKRSLAERSWGRRSTPAGTTWTATRPTWSRC